MLDTLYARLTAGLLAVLLGVTGLFVVIDLVSNRRLLQEINQDVHRDLARHLLEESIPMEDGEIQPEALEHIFHMLMVINPAIEVYLLSSDGSVLSYSGPEGSVVRMKVALEPIHEFLEDSKSFPILGDDPRSPHGRKVFSVAPLERNEGFLYVILGGQQYQTTATMVQASRALRLGLAGLAATLLAAIAAGLWLFARITRPVRSLATSVRRFQGSDFESPELLAEHFSGPKASVGRRDEIAGLEDTVSEMALRLAKQLQETKKTDALRRELMANVSHDLRTPITSLRGYLETLIVKSSELSANEKQRYIETALRHSERLGDLVLDLFELSKLDSLTTEVHLER
ncbi:MAG: sensor histidine kinase, partial [Acidobacteriota bacterium]|nr:sensor histidine kinase [Acidobacteriota bacterium]